MVYGKTVNTTCDCVLLSEMFNFYCANANTQYHSTTIHGTQYKYTQYQLSTHVIEIMFQYGDER